MPTRVLLIDDEPDMLALLAAMLSGPEWDIVGRASSGQEALELATATRPEIAVIDYMMPGMDGLELAEHLKTAVPECHNVIFTAYPGIGAEAVSRDSVDSFVNKNDVSRIDEVLASIAASRSG